jgi:hypothetical protein
MALEMVLNELSFQSADGVHTARQWMSTLVRTAREASLHGVSRVIRTHTSVLELMLAHDYPLWRWLSDSEVDIEERRYMRSLSNKVPFWDGIPELYDQVLASEFLFQGREAQGLGVAYLLESLAISLASDECWDVSLVLLTANWLAQDGDIEQQLVQVIHASQIHHVHEHRNWIQKRLRSDIRNGDDLWERRGEILPSLDFCDAVEPQIRGLSASILQSAARRLSELEIYCRTWTTGGFDPSQLPAKATLESEATLNQFGSERTFRCPDGIERTFSWHLRLTPDAWRILFLPETKARKMIIGYIGPHLPTAKYH